MAGPLKVMCVHGLGKHSGTNWFAEWEAAIGIALGPDAQFKAVPVEYDPIFEGIDLSLGETAAAVGTLLGSKLQTLGRRDKGFFNPFEWVEYRVGYVIAWLEDEGFKKKTRKLILDKIAAEKPDVILAHSLGSLLTYNAFTHPDAKAKAVADTLGRLHYVTLGSQLNNDYVKGTLAHGKLMPLPVRAWTNLFNPRDKVFTKHFTLPAMPTFRAVLTDAASGHAATGYIAHAETRTAVWAPEADRRAPKPKAKAGARTKAKALAAPVEQPRAPRRRALIVGINDYPREQDRLEGCVNDAFTMSAVLQECDFPVEEIRLCLNDRATEEGILDRLAWLLDDPVDGDQLVFYFSGHGTRVPAYGEDGTPDRLRETLVAWDHDWKRESRLTDVVLKDLYGQLPYDTQFLMILDCCNSGGMTRQGGARARGITPPDDVRHRQLKWDPAEQVWVDRPLPDLNPAFSDDAGRRAAFFGENGATEIIGRASALRVESQSEYDAAKKAAGTRIGPYAPLVLTACQTEELAYEYRDGATSHGAFTFMLAQLLRAQKGPITFEALKEEVGQKLSRLRYQQTPDIFGADAMKKAPVPFRVTAPKET